MQAHKLLAALVTLAALAAPARANVIAGPRSVGAYFNTTNLYSHAVVATTANQLIDIRWTDSSATVTTRVLGTLPATITAASAYFNKFDGSQHAIAALSNGDLVDLRYTATGLVPQTTVASLSGYGGASSGIKSISAWADSKGRLNVAFITRFLGDDVAGVWAQSAFGSSTGAVTLLNFYAFNATADISGFKQDLSTAFVTVAYKSGSVSAIDQYTWDDSTGPSAFVMVSQSSSTPWGTLFPGAGQPSELISTLSGSSSAHCQTCTNQFVPIMQLDYASGFYAALRSYPLWSWGGPRTYPEYGGSVSSVAGPNMSFTDANNESTFRRNTIIVQGNAVSDISALLNASPITWSMKPLGSF